MTEPEPRLSVAKDIDAPSPRPFVTGTPENSARSPIEPVAGRAASTSTSNLPPLDPDRVIRIDLPCVGCGYDLKGISPEGACPECGLGARRTLLYVVDPAASEIAPLQHGYMLGTILFLIPLVLVFAAVTFWAPHIQYALQSIEGTLQPIVDPRFYPLRLIAGVAVLFAAALVMCLRSPTGHPTRRSYRNGILLAFFGLAIFGGFSIVLTLYDQHAGTWRASLYDNEEIDLVRSVIRLAGDAGAFLAILGFPAVIRFLALRSLYHRVSQVSRQGFLAMGVAVGVVALGDLLWLITAILDGSTLGSGEVTARTVDRFALVSAMLILVGSGMLTLALFNSLIDALRLARNINRPRYQRKQVVW